MLILVTGSTGFIGSQLCRRLVAEGHRVRAFHRPSSSQLGLQGLAVEHAVGDVRQPETLAAAMQGVEVVFHTAAMLGRQGDPRAMAAVTVEGTRSVLQAAAQAGVRRVVHTSSVAALGVPDLPGRRGVDLLMDEHHTWNYRPEWWPYGHTKYRAELAVQDAVAAGLDVVIVNPAIVVGAGDLNRISGDVIVQVAKGRLPVAVEGGLNVVHIADVVRGHLLAMEHGRTGERYILGGENMPIPRFLSLAAEASGRRAPRLVLPGTWVRTLARPAVAAGGLLPRRIRGDALRRAGYYFYYDTLKARTELGLSGLLPARQAVEEAVAWYRQQGVL